MIICNRCGERNADQALACSRCGHKLRSRREAGETGGGRRRELAKLGHSRDSAFARLLGRTVLVWLSAVLLLSAVVYGMSGGGWWPVAPAAVPALAAAFLTRN